MLRLPTALASLTLLCAAVAQADPTTPDVQDCTPGATPIEQFPERLLGDEKNLKAPYYIQLPLNYDTVKITEVARKTRLAEDLDKLVNPKLTGQPQCFYLTPKMKRANVTIEYSGTNQPAKVKKIVTGPAEHLYLGADMPVTSIKQVSYDSTTNTLVEKEKPASFYGSVNWRFGDLLSGYDRDNYLNNVSFKLLAQASRKPDESMGVGFGYSFGAIEVFVARLWTKDEENTYSTSPGTTQSTAFGLTFNIAKGIEWFNGE